MERLADKAERTMDRLLKLQGDNRREQAVQEVKKYLEECVGELERKDKILFS